MIPCEWSGWCIKLNDQEVCIHCQVSSSYKWTSLTLNNHISLSLLYYICTKGNLSQKDIKLSFFCILQVCPTQTSCHFFIQRDITLSNKTLEGIPSCCVRLTSPTLRMKNALAIQWDPPCWWLCFLKPYCETFHQINRISKNIMDVFIVSYSKVWPCVEDEKL